MPTLCRIFGDSPFLLLFVSTQKAQTFVVCLYSVSKDLTGLPLHQNISTEKPTLAHEHYGFSLEYLVSIQLSRFYRDQVLS